MSDPRVAARHAAKELVGDERAPGALLEALGELGLAGVALPAEVGGDGGGLTELAAVVEELAVGVPALAALLAAHASAVGVVAAHGTPEQRGRIVPALAQGHEAAALAVDEGRSGLDADAVTTRADDAGRLTGTKRTALLQARVLVVLAREDAELSMYVVRRGPAGPRAEGDALVFSATPGERLGRPGAGRRIALRAADRARIVTAALATGVAGAALAAGGPELAGADVRVAAAGSLTARAAHLADLGLPHAVEGATAERLALALARELAAAAGRTDLLAALPG